MMTTNYLNIFTREMLCPQHFSQQNIRSMLLRVVIGEQKNNFIDKFKLELITIYLLCFVMKVL